MIKDTQKKATEKAWYHGKAGIFGFLFFFVFMLLDSSPLRFNVALDETFIFLEGIGLGILASYVAIHFDRFFEDK